jgi:ribonuclease HII
MKGMYKNTICGIDEAGRGALAGPLVVAGVVMPLTFDFQKLNLRVPIRDSKKLSKQQRETLFQIIEKYSLQIRVEVIPVREINKHGINWAEIEGFRRCIMVLEADKYIIDGKWHLPDLGDKTPLVSCVIDADEYIPAVLSAGIVAKVKRDEMMKKLHERYPMYGWDKNTGHGTRYHIQAIKEYGLCKEHRKQFVATALRKSGDFYEGNRGNS